MSTHVVPAICSWWLKVTSHPKDEEFARAALTVSLVVFATLWYSWLLVKSRRSESKLSLPPGPSGLPLVGNLPFLDPDLHRCFADLAKVHGPIMKIQLGQKLCIVVSSPSVAKLVLKDHDIIFADRDTPSTAQTLTYGGNDLVWAPYGATWRMLRKLCVGELLSKTSLDAVYALRRREVRRTVREVYAMKGKPINIGEQMFLTMSNLVTGMLWGVTLKGEERDRVGAEFKSIVMQILELISKLNLSDVFPFLMDVQGLKRKTKVLLSKIDVIFDSIIDMRERKIRSEGEESRNGGENEDFLHSFMQRVGDSKEALTKIHIKSLFLNMVVAGTDTTSITVEWAMAEMMNKPEIMKKAQDELAQVVGINNTVEEHHLAKLDYLNAVIKEVMRLHPVGPLLLPRRSREMCTLDGYTIPSGTQVLVNVWAIQRDPKNWDNPSEFDPQRFLRGNTKWDYNGSDFRFLPFGSGRRICAGISLAERMVPHVLGSLLHSYNWKLAEGMELDLKEMLMLTLKKDKPTILVAEPRLSSHELYV